MCGKECAGVIVAFEVEAWMFSGSNVATLLTGGAS